MTHEHIEPGLLQVFRRFIVVQWALLALALCGAASEDGAASTYFPLLFFAHTTLLGGYLWSGWLRRRLGRRYLPLALIVVSLGPSLVHAAATALRMNHGLDGDAALIDPSGAILWLIVPLLLISSQYSLRVMLTFCLGTALLDVALAGVLVLNGGPSMDPTTEEVVVRVLLFSIVGYVVVRLTTAQRQQRDLLAQTNAKLTNYALTLEQLATSRERNRMARELHDTLAHTLSAVSVQLQALEILKETDPSAMDDTLQLTHRMIRDGLHDTRRVLAALRASPLEDLGLALAVRQLAESAAGRAGLELQLDLPERLADVPPTIEQHVYRVAEEAINNVVRHANARTLAVALQPCHAGLTLRVRDDGVGFDPQQPVPDGHYGLTGMRERMAICGGELALTSQPGQGTTIEVSIKDMA